MEGDNNPRIDSAWKAATTLTVHQAAALMAGLDPGDHHEWEYGYECKKYRVISQILNKDIEMGALKRCVYLDDECNSVYSNDISVDDLIEWVKLKKLQQDFFLTSGPVTGNSEPEYMNPDHPRYPAKLAIGVKAWYAVTEVRGKHPKQALEQWLREHAHSLGLVKPDGSLNQVGIEEIAKVVNWNPRGGAPKTPGG